MSGIGRGGSGGGHPIDPGGGNNSHKGGGGGQTPAARSLQELSPTARQLRDRVSFFERVWTSGSGGSDAVELTTPGVAGAYDDIEDYEQRIRGRGHATSTVLVSHDVPDHQQPPPVFEVRKKRDGSFEELCSKRSAPSGHGRTTPTLDPSASFLYHERQCKGPTAPKSSRSFEEGIYRHHSTPTSPQSGRIFTTTTRTNASRSGTPSEEALYSQSPYSPTTPRSATTLRGKTLSSRTPSEEVLDSAYQTQYSSSQHGVPKTVAPATITTSVSSDGISRFTSDESLMMKRTPSRERADMTSGSSDTSGGSRVMSSSEWYSEYRSSSFQQTTNREYFRSKSEYDDHITLIRGRDRQR